ncbi:MAG: cell division protein FtsA [Candidatus Ryanbacteria bacterium CG10_big_fil_rev_8_21_14_0_10_43_42]|uniref:Cell division protein FtsA n=1 Tax=Candidatus Ryanbacteria bacterium CG10_big_fil_rev_8_21_14_0_10_43_42 TaxID=1974864 RepID=A0A2M8KXA0_9BACT|nr:MAG: cell division protein FtsA [Candidatus Ryanbacteria bacterium CG10_big_fil_rev_8_21_14_0_10_43_42]
MGRNNITVGLDVGSSTIRIAAMAPDTNEGASLLGYGVSRALGVRRGIVIDVADATKSISEARTEAERIIGMPITHAYVSFGGPGLMVYSARGTVAVSRADGEISEHDIDRVQQAAHAELPQLSNREILHEVVLTYAVDREVDIKNPVGMIGNRLEAQMLFITAFTPHLKNLLRSVEAAGITVDDVVAAPLASSRAILSKHQREIGVLHMDIGGATASLAVFEEGSLLSASIFPLGCDHITNDIAIGFQIPLDAAEHMKIMHGTLLSEAESKKDVVRLADFMPESEAFVSRKDLADIMAARAADIFEMTEKHLKKIGRSGLLPSGVVLTGGGASMHGVVDFARRELKLPAEIGMIQAVAAPEHILIDPAWTVAIGLCLWAGESNTGRSFGAFSMPKVGAYIMRVIRPLIP